MKEIRSTIAGMKAQKALLLAALLASPLGAQVAGLYPPRDLTKDAAPAPSDTYVTWKAGVARALRTDPAGVVSAVDPQSVHVTCLGVDDTIAINLGVARAQAAGADGGAVLRLHGACVYSGAGIVNDPALGVTQHLVIQGDGVTASSINFTACSNAQCILLTNENAVGSGFNDGSGVRDISLTFPNAVDGIVVNKLEEFLLDNVYTRGGATALTVSESRNGTVRSSTFRQFTANGIKVVGEAFAANFFRDLNVVSTAPPTGDGVVYMKTGTADAGGVFFQHVVVNGTFAGSGFHFEASTAHSVFVFLNDCVADGNFQSGGSFKLVKIINANLVNPFGVNQYTASNAAGLVLDAASDVTVTGGTFYADTGALGSDISLKNSVARTTVIGTRLRGLTLAVRVDGTTHGIDLRPSFYQTTYTNDATKIPPRSPAVGVTPVAGSAGTIATGFLGTGAATSSTYLRGDGAWSAPPGVTSVALSAPSWLAVSGTPVTTSGTLALAAATGQTAGRVVGTCGAGTSVSLCALVAGDLPTVTAAKGGTGIDTSASTGVPRVSAGTWTANAGLSHLATSTSADLRGILSDESGSGVALFGSSPTATDVTINQATNGDTALTMSRATDSSPTGNFQLLKTAGGSTLWQVDVTGSLAAGAVPVARVTGLATVATSASAADLSTGTLAAGRMPALTGDVTTSAGAVAATIAAGAVTDSKASDDLTINNTSSVTTTGAITATGHYGVTTNGTATVTCTGTGTSPTAPSIAGSDSAFIVRMFTGTGVTGSTGTCTVTYGSAYVTNQPVVVCMLVSGGNAWGNDADVQLTTESLTAPVLTWNNNASGVPTPLAVSSSYKISCVVFKK